MATIGATLHATADAYHSTSDRHVYDRVEAIKAHIMGIIDGDPIVTPQGDYTSLKNAAEGGAYTLSIIKGFTGDKYIRDRCEQRLVEWVSKTKEYKGVKISYDREFGFIKFDW